MDMAELFERLPFVEKVDLDGGFTGYYDGDDLITTSKGNANILGVEYFDPEGEQIGTSHQSTPGGTVSYFDTDHGMVGKSMPNQDWSRTFYRPDRSIVGTSAPPPAATGGSYSL